MEQTINYRGYDIEISRDEYPENPIKEWDMLGKFICFHRRYDLGNCSDFKTPDEVIAYAKKNRAILFNLYMYEHSGIVLSLSNSSYPFNDRWDSGQVGFVMVERDKALKEYEYKILCKSLLNKIRKIVEGEVKTYNLYLAGEVYNYYISKNGEFVDSAGGYFCDDEDELIGEVKSIVDSEVKQDIKNHTKQVKKWIVNKVPFINRTPLCVG